MRNINAVKASSVKIFALGGLGEIGMNCMLIEDGNEAIVIDCGVLFSDLNHFGVEFIIPNFECLLARKSKIRGIILTHGHEDHIGAIPFILKLGIRAPIYASHFTGRLLSEKLKEHSLPHKVDMHEFRPGERLAIGRFKIKTIPVNHSIVDSAALVIETSVGRIVHTGDFKIEPTPFYGSTIDLKSFEEAGDKGVHLLLSDSTNVERHDPSLSEKILTKSFEDLFASPKGLTVVSLFASNVSRMGQVFSAAKRHKMKVLLSGRSVEQVVQVARETGYLKDSGSSIISPDNIKSYPRNKIIVLATGSQGEHRASLSRIARGEHSLIQLRQGDRVLMSSRVIPGNEKAIGQMIDSLFKQGAEVLYESVHCIHTTGHASRPELARMLKLVRPKFFVPIHGEYRHLVKHAALAKETGVQSDRIMIATNGDTIEVTPKSCRVIRNNEKARVFIQDRQSMGISNEVLKHRKNLGTGVVFALLVINSDFGTIIAGPQIILHGILDVGQEKILTSDSVTFVKSLVSRSISHGKTVKSANDLEEEIRIGLRRFLEPKLGKKPTVVPVVMNV